MTEKPRCRSSCPTLAVIITINKPTDEIRSLNAIANFHLSESKSSSRQFADMHPDFTTDQNATHYLGIDLRNGAALLKLWCEYPC